MKRLEGNVKNGLAVVSVKRDACGGCFNKIPPQRQLDIKLHKKIIICEHCGRILVDEEELPEKLIRISVQYLAQSCAYLFKLCSFRNSVNCIISYSLLSFGINIAYIYEIIPNTISNSY